MLEFRTQGFNGYALKYSPFFDSRLAVASAANFGLVGNGRLYILNLESNGIIAEKWYFSACMTSKSLRIKQTNPTEQSSGSTLKMLSTTSPGRKTMRIKCWGQPEMVLSNSSTSRSTSSLFSHGRSTSVKSLQCTGTWSRKIHSAQAHGMALSRL